MKTILAFLAIFMCSNLAHGQKKEKIINLPGYEKDRFHFGFSFTGLRSDLYIDMGQNQVNYTVTSSPQTGFGMNIISDLNLHKNLSVRFCPGISFIAYQTYLSQLQTNYSVIAQQIAATTLDFPFEIKVRTNRFGNLGLFAASGMNYAYFIQEKQSIQSPGSAYFTKDDISLRNGLGAEYYFPYFKMSVDLKYALGIKNIYNTSSGNGAGVNAMKSRAFLVTLCFEG